MAIYIAKWQNIYKIYDYGNTHKLFGVVMNTGYNASVAEGCEASEKVQVGSAMKPTY